MGLSTEERAPLNAQHFRRRLFYAQGAALLFGALRLILLLLAGMAVASVIQISAARILSPSIEWLRGSWIVLVGIVMTFFLKTLKNLWSSCRINSVATKLGAQPVDLFITAWELASQKISDEFRTRALAQADQAFPKKWLDRLIPARWTIFSGSLLLCLFLFFALKSPSVSVMNQTLWPFGPSSSGRLSVTPGNSFFPRGEDVAISVRVSTGTVSQPRLEVREDRMAWEERSLRYVSLGVYSTTLRSLQNPLAYRIVHRLGRSARYRLVPFDPPRLRHLQAEVDPPAYSSRKAEQLNDVFSLRVLSGSRVRWSFLLDPLDSHVRIDPETSSLLVKKGEEWSFTAEVENKQDHRLWARLNNGSSEVLLAELSMETLPDEPPQVTLLAPSDDLEADGNEPLPVTVEITEDVGLSQMGISFRVKQGVWSREVWKRFPPGTVHEIMEELFDLGKSGVKTGDPVEFYVWARDRRSPPGEGRSVTRRIDVLDFNAIHHQVLGELESFQKALRARLFEEREIREKVAVSTPVWRGLLTEQRQVARRLKNEEERFMKLLESMAQDPWTDRGTLLEHEGIAGNLQNLNQATMAEVDRQVSAQDPSRATRALDQAVSEMERMRRLSTEAVREQNLLQLVRDHSQLSYQAEILVRSMEKQSAMPEEDFRQFQETVHSLKETMDRIRARVEELRKNQPEEDVKNAALEVLRFDRVADSLARLTRALQEKNGTDALSAAQNALDQLREIEKQLNRAGSSQSSFGSPTEAALSEEQEQLKALVQRQESLLDRTRDVAEKKLSRFLAQQSETLALLRRAASQWESLGGKSTFPETRRLGALAREMIRGLDSGQGKVVLDKLKEFIIQANLPPHEKQEIFDMNEWASIATEAKILLEKLAKEQGDNELIGSEKKNLPLWAEEQQELAGATRSLSEKLTEIVQQTALLPPNVLQQISAAASQMDEATLALRSMEVLLAQDKQEKALDLLRDTNGKISNALSQMQSLSAGTGGTPSFRRKGGGAWGGTTGDVNIPRGDEFRPPVEFRQEIMDSMKEAYPTEEEGPVRNYYRHWTK